MEGEQNSQVIEKSWPPSMEVISRAEQIMLDRVARHLNIQEVTSNGRLNPNPEKYASGNSGRFYFINGVTKEGKEVFIKAAADESSQIAYSPNDPTITIHRQAEADNIAQRLNAQMLTLSIPLTRLKGQQMYVIGYPRFDDEAAIRPEEVKDLPAGFGGDAAKVLLSSTSHPIPEDIKSESLDRGDWRLSKVTFRKVWDEQIGIIEQYLNKNTGNLSITSEEFSEIIKSGDELIAEMIDNAPESEQEFFCHGDASPSNTVRTPEGGLLLTDTEWARASRIKVLSQLVDLTNFYGRLWPNPEVQKEFLAKIMEGSNGNGAEDGYKLAKLTAIFGATFLAKYPLGSINNGEETSEFSMGKALMDNLQRNLQFLDAKREELRGK